MTMAAMVARGSSQLPPPGPHQENGHRNKRKFRADPPVLDSNELEMPQVDSPNFGFALEFNAEQHGSGVCDICSSLSCHPDDELDVDGEPAGADWNVPTETQLKELLLSNLDTIFSSAIKKIASHGYNEAEVMEAVLSLGQHYGSKDTLSSIVENALAFLNGGQEADTSSDIAFEDLQHLEEHVLSEMICVLRDMHPFFSSGDAMWCLLICDMDLSRACGIDGDTLFSLGGDEMALPSSLPQMKPDTITNTVVSDSLFELNSGKPYKPNALAPYPQTGVVVPNGLPPVAGIPNLPPVKLASFNNTSNAMVNASILNPNSTKENISSFTDCVVEKFSSTCSSENQEKLLNGKRCNGVGISKRDSMLRHKSMHFDKSYRAYRSRGAYRSGKHSNLGSLLDKKSKPSSDSIGINLKNSMLKKNKPLGADALQVGENHGLSFNAGSSVRFPLSSKTDSSASQLPLANTELALSLPSRSTFSSSSSSTSNALPSNNDAPIFSNLNGFSSDRTSRQWALPDKKDELMNKLVPCVRELQAQLQEWSEWAQQKVMQAARRLGKDKGELQSLRHEKEEVIRLQKEKIAMEENTSKKISEMESAVMKAGNQVEKSNGAIRRLQLENAHLRQQMDAAKLRAAKSAADCQEISKREVKTLKTFQFSDRQKAQLHEELMVDKQKLSQLQQQFDQDKACLDQLEAKLNQEEKMKDDMLLLVQSERKEREQMEISAKSKDDTIRLKTENNQLLHKEDMRKLENQLSQLRLKTDSPKIAALRQGASSTYAARVAGGLSTSQKDFSAYSSQFVELIEPGDNGVQRERECVMCLTEEMSVVFLPCAHQVVCGTCNDLHEQQGMKDCPSCRTPIEQRIAVRLCRS